MTEDDENRIPKGKYKTAQLWRSAKRITRESWAKRNARLGRQHGTVPPPFWGWKPAAKGQE